MGKSTRSSTQTQIELHTLRVTGTPGTQLPVCQVLVKAVEATVLTRTGYSKGIIPNRQLLLSEHT